MKSVLLTFALMLMSQMSIADNVHPVVANYNKTILASTEYLYHSLNYVPNDFNDLVGISTLQDTTRKIRVIKFKFSPAVCAKDVEVYTKLDGSAVLSNKVVGCAP